MDDLAQVLSGTVDEVTAGLGEMSAETLTALHKAESEGQNRSTLLAALDRAKADKASTAALGGAANDDAATLVFTQAQMDEALAAQKLRFDAEKERAVAEARAAAGKAAKSPAAAKVTPAKPLSIGDKSEVTAVLTGGGSVVFVDNHDVPLGALPAMAFAADAFEPAGEGAKLKRDVNFPNGLPASEITSAFLLDVKEAVVGRARLIGAVAIGGGRDVQLPGGALLFERG